MGNYMVLQEDNLKQLLKIMMAESNIDSMASLARNLDVKETTFRTAINNQTIRIKDFIEMADKLGYEVILKSK